MDIELELIGSLLRLQDVYLAATMRGVKEDDFETPAGKKGWKFIIDHLKKFGSIPTRDFFIMKTEIVPPEESSEKDDVLISEILDRSLWNALRQLGQDMQPLVDKKQSHEALDHLVTKVRQLYDDGLTRNKIVEITSLGRKVIEGYERAKTGITGILTPWKAMNDLTMGWSPGDFVVIVARAATGKTFALLMNALEAWRSGKKVLFIGTEMTMQKLAVRLYCLYAKLPYQDFKHGRLDAFAEKRLYEAVSSLENMKGFQVLGNDFDVSLNSIFAVVDMISPDIVFVDGLYLVKNDKKERHAQVSHTADEFKRLSLRKNIPFVTSTQFNRDVSSNSRMNVDTTKIGITDVIGWDADIIFGMYQTDDMKEDGIMGFRPMKLREGSGSDFFSNWKFDEMNFDQIKSPGVAAEYSDRDYNSLADDSSDGIAGEKEQQDLF